MDFTAETAAAAAAGGVLDVQGLYAHLQTVTDTRQRRGLRYELALVLTLMVLAKLSGEDTPSGIAEWAKHRVRQLARAFELQRVCMPHHSTYRRILAEVVAVDELEQVAGSFLSWQAEPGRSVVISIDGKTVRGTLDGGATQGTHLLAAYLPEEGLVLLKMEVGVKENEIPVAQRVLQRLDLRGKVVTTSSRTWLGRRRAPYATKDFNSNRRRRRGLCLVREG